MNLVDRAQHLALRYHAGQCNNHDGEPYILHVHRVFMMVRDARLDVQYQCVAWLHDILEDTDCTVEELLDIFPEAIVAGVVAITKRKGESNDDYYTRLLQNRLASYVKLQDFHDNFRRNHQIEDEATRLRLAQKYSKGLDRLTQAGIV